MNEQPQHHKDELIRLYIEHGVGDTLDHQFNFWTQHSGGNFSHDLTNAQKVAAWEKSHLLDTFPQDFQLL